MEEITLNCAANKINILHSKAVDINSLALVMMLVADNDMVIGDFKGALSILYNVSEDFCREIYELQEQIYKTIRSNADKLDNRNEKVSPENFR